MGNITPKEAIANLNHIYGIVSPDIQRSLDVAIKALERPAGDCISRSELMKAIGTMVEAEMPIDEKWALGLKYSLKVIDNAPTVEPRDNFDLGYVKGLEDGKATARPQGKQDRPKGEWIEKEATPASVYYCCSNCGMEGVPVTPYCPWCGAQMKGGAE